MRRPFLLLLAGVFVAGCNPDQNLSGPGDPDARALGEPQGCGDVRQYLEKLVPVLAQWEESTDAWLEGDVLTTPPVLADTTENEDYLEALGGTLAVWEDSLESRRGQDFLMSVPPYEMGTTDPATYLQTLSPTLADWRNAIHLWRGTDFLDEPPVFAEDTTAPEITCPSDTTVTSSDGEGVVVKFDVTATDFCTENPKVSCEPASGTVFPIGETAVTCTATDDAGNESSCSFTVTVEAALPTITCPPDTSVACAGPEGTPVEFVVTAEDGGGGPLEVTCDPESGSLFPVGDTMVTCTAADTLGNSVECSFTVTVVDTVAPTIECPGDMVVECGTEEGVVVEFDVFASDECDSNVVVTSDPASGSTFPIGETTVTSTATDGSGNATSCTFTVTVEEATPPEIDDVISSHAILWPPNHRMVNVELSYVLGESCGEVSCTIEDVTANEPINGVGDGNTEPDWMVTGDGTLRLRAERSGTGSGRIYSVHVTCTDELGQVSRDTVDIIVPHDNR